MYNSNRCMNFNDYSNMEYNNADNFEDYGVMQNTNMNFGGVMQGITCPVIYECPRISYVNRTICHTVPHIVPCETRVINRHVYHHTYTPSYKMSECNTKEDVYDDPNVCC